MQKNNTILVMVLALGLAFGYLLGFGKGNESTVGERYDRDSQMMGQGMMGNYDQRFIEQMIPHHEGAIDMAELALKKSKRPEILSLAKGIIEAQQAEIKDMKEWYKDWYGKEVVTTNVSTAGGHMMGHMDSMSGDLTKLSASQDFDLEFIRQMIPHHEMAVMMASMLENSTERKEMKQLADNIITSQTREIEMMRSWEKEWSK